MPLTRAQQDQRDLNDKALQFALEKSKQEAGDDTSSGTQVPESSKSKDTTTRKSSRKNAVSPATATKKSRGITKKPSSPRKSQPLRQSDRLSKKTSKVNIDSKTSKVEEVVSSTTIVFATPRKTRGQTKKDQPVSAIDIKPKSSGRVLKDKAPSKQAKNRTKFIIKFAIPYKQLDYTVLKALSLRRPKLEKDYWPYPHYPGFKLGHNPWAHLNWPAPDVNQIRKVHQVLSDHHRKFDFGSYVSMPAHATEAKVTIDAVFQTLFAQSTDNEIAIDTHSRLCNAFPFVVNGKKYAGKMPNWHDIRLLEREELQTALHQGGFHEMRAGYMKGILDTVYQKNLDRKAAGKQQYEHEGNPPDAMNFVPGLLSMDWLTDEEDNSDEAILGRLIQLNGIGIKSAMCVMAFSMKRPLFVVDVHVLRYAQWLGWVPSETTNVDWVAMYLHNYIPDDIKYDLHNQIWTHCANENTKESKKRAVICPFCGARPPARNRDVSQHTCPLSELLPPLEERWGKAYTLQLRQEVRQAARKESASDESNDDQLSSEDTENAAVTTLKQTSIIEFANGLPTPPSSPVELSMQLSDEVIPATSEEAISPTQKKKVKQLNLNAKSHRFEDISQEQAQELQAAGYYLWEFRPMDNTFMEEWGTFEKKPRYKWERDTIMDKDVAVTWERANNVLNHDADHKWSRKSGQEITTHEIMAAMKT